MSDWVIEMLVFGIVFGIYGWFTGLSGSGKSTRRKVFAKGIEKITELRDKGMITDKQFVIEENKLLEMLKKK